MAAVDRFEGHIGSRVDPPGHAFEVIPDDDEELEAVTRAIILGTAGAVRVLTARNEDITYPALLAGVQYSMRIKQIFATGTTATGIVGQD